MTINISRRNMIKLTGAAVVAGSVITPRHLLATELVKEKQKHTIAKVDTWSKTHDRTWIGGEYWANPMEDWCIKNGGVESLSNGGNRSVHSLTYQITDPTQGFEISTIVTKIESQQQDGGGGIRLGARSELNEVKSNCFVQQGVDVGILNQDLVLGNKKVPIHISLEKRAILIRVTATPVTGAITLKAVAKEASSETVLAEISHIVSSDELLGNVAVVSNFNIDSTWGNIIPENKQGSRYRFEEFTLSGYAFTKTEANQFGPVLWSMYTVNNTATDEGYVLKLSAYTGPLGEHDNQTIALEFKQDGHWVHHSDQTLDPLAWMATFRIANWDESNTTEFRVVYRQKFKDGTQEPGYWSGLIQAEPKGQPLRMAAFTCQNDYAYPYAPVVNNVAALVPDILFFSGDQIYESHGGFGVVRSPDDKAILNYLRKYYQFGWAFREVMRNTPTVCIPDDHDVLQGNMWGESGAAMKNPEKDPSASVLAGYIHSPRFVNVVHKTHTAHHPEAFNPVPKTALNGIMAYYGELVYGDVGFAILSDRQFKSGPDHVGAVVGQTGRDESPFSFNQSLDSENLHILGEEQENFVRQWSNKWQNHSLKAVLSQTIFAGLATHNGGADKYLKYDFDSNGWPASPRNRAVDAMRQSMALHICGDTHLASLSQYGVEQQRDSNWAFCVPAIGAGWQRFWFPEQVGLPVNNKPKHGLADCGEYVDAFGNKNYVYAVANPVRGVSKNRYVRAQEKGSGFGMITFDTKAKTYLCTAYRFLADVTDPSADNVYPGWPVLIEQAENQGVNKLS